MSAPLYTAFYNNLVSIHLFPVLSFRFSVYSVSSVSLLLFSFFSFDSRNPLHSSVYSIRLN